MHQWAIRSSSGDRHSRKCEDKSKKQKITCIHGRSEKLRNPAETTVTWLELESLFGSGDKGPQVIDLSAGHNFGEDTQPRGEAAVGNQPYEKEWPLTGKGMASPALMTDTPVSIDGFAPPITQEVGRSLAPCSPGGVVNPPVLPNGRRVLYAMGKYGELTILTMGQLASPANWRHITHFKAGIEKTPWLNPSFSRGKRREMLENSMAIFQREADWDPEAANVPGAARAVHVVVYRHKAGGMWCMLLPVSGKWVWGDYTKSCPFENPLCLYGKFAGGGHRCKDKVNHVPITRLEVAVYKYARPPPIKLHRQSNMIILDPKQCGDIICAE